MEGDWSKIEERMLHNYSKQDAVATLHMYKTLYKPRFAIRIKKMTERCLGFSLELRRRPLLMIELVWWEFTIGWSEPVAGEDLKAGDLVCIDEYGKWLKATREEKPIGFACGDGKLQIGGRPTMDL